MIKTASSEHSEQRARSPQNEDHVKGVVACTICDAVYAPAPAHQSLMQAPPKVLEAAFMSICHFCFRCRRPACPACWDSVHGVCGACVQEAHLPFRVEAAPLEGVVFSPMRQARPAQENSSPPLLVCIHAGRFQTAVSPSNHPPKGIPAAPVKNQLAEKAEDNSQLSTSHKHEVTPASPKQDSGALVKPAAAVRFFKTVERIITVILLIILIAILAMIILAEVSVTANAQFVRLFQIDIRNEIAYLISLVQRVHF